jgi:tetratricopeptide (TPR) repeat protein
MKSPVEQLLAQGERHLEAGRWADAEAAFRRAAETEPLSAAALSKLGVALIRQGRRDDAEQAFARAVAANPGYAPAWSNLGNVYREKDQTAKALEAYERAIAADPDYYVAHENLAALYAQMGRVSDKIAAMRKATRLKMRAAVRPQAGEPGETAGRRGCLGRATVLVLILLAAAAVFRL